MLSSCWVPTASSTFHRNRNWHEVLLTSRVKSQSHRGPHRQYRSQRGSPFTGCFSCAPVLIRIFATLSFMFPLGWTICFLPELQVTRCFQAITLLCTSRQLSEDQRVNKALECPGPACSEFNCKMEIIRSQKVEPLQNVSVIACN